MTINDLQKQISVQTFLMLLLSETSSISYSENCSMLSWNSKKNNNAFNERISKQCKHNYELNTLTTKNKTKK